MTQTPAPSPLQPHQSPQAVLLIGAGGMLGKAWQQLLGQKNIAFLAPTSKELDITREADIARHITDQTRVVINCAAWTDVDAAESSPEAAMALNGQAPGLLAAQCKKTGAKLVHYSTDYVFDGSASSPYTTDQPRNPLGVYGRTKAAGEEAIEESQCNHLIIRTSWLYAPWGKNFVRTIAKLGRVKDKLSVVNDQTGRPTSSQHLASVSYQLIDQHARSIYHVTDQGQCTWYDFAREIIRLDGSACEVSPCSTDEFPRPAKRPVYSVLDLTQTQKLNDLPTWQQNLAQVMRDMEPFS